MLEQVSHRHISNIDLMAYTACLVCLISTVNCRIKKERKQKPWKTGISNAHITNLKQSIFVFQYVWG